jgi:hypothetical protein
MVNLPLDASIAQMAIFLLRGIHSPYYQPPVATGAFFNDVPVTAFAAAWIEQLAEEGITAGCGSGMFCPNNSVTHAQMAIFLLRSKHGTGYTPPSQNGHIFMDVPYEHPQVAWIEELFDEDISEGARM